MNFLNSILLKTHFLAACLILTCYASAQQEAAKIIKYDYDAGPQPQCDLGTAQFTLWTGQTEGKINGIFILLPGRNGDGRGLVNNKAYQDLAEKWDFALMGCFLQSKVNKDIYQVDQKGDTARLLNKALAELAKISKKPELDTAPVFCFGTSAGGNIASQYPNVFPQRTIGCVSFIPTLGPGSSTKEKKSVPMLIAIGAKDSPGFVAQSEGKWAAGSPGAVWTLAKHKDLGHNGGPAFELAMVWAEAVLTQRLRLDGKGKVVSLQKLQINKGWVGDLETYKVEKSAGKISSKETWLPDEATATAWNKYLTTAMGK